jgi:hypothetical protein
MRVLIQQKADFEKLISTYSQGGENYVMVRFRKAWKVLGSVE